jgi:hypothetical protein
VSVTELAPPADAIDPVAIIVAAAVVATVATVVEAAAVAAAGRPVSVSTDLGLAVAVAGTVGAVVLTAFAVVATVAAVANLVAGTVAVVVVIAAVVIAPVVAAVALKAVAVVAVVAVAALVRNLESEPLLSVNCYRMSHRQRNHRQENRLCHRYPPQILLQRNHRLLLN